MLISRALSVGGDSESKEHGGSALAALLYNKKQTKIITEAAGSPWRRLNAEYLTD